MTYREAIQKQIDAARARAQANGWTFKERTPEKASIGDFIGAVLEIDNPTDARSFFEGLVEERRPGIAETSPKDAVTVAQEGIGWCFAEGMSDQRKQMWIEVCNATHPVFGQQTPTIQDAFKAGLRMGKGLDK